MTNFQEQIQALHREYRNLDQDDFVIAGLNARERMCNELRLAGAYHLWENGHAKGDASGAEMTGDAIALGINVSDAGWRDELFVKLDKEFIRIFSEELEAAQESE